MAVFIGTTRELYTWSLLSCVVLFLSGSCFSVYIGAESLMTPHDPAEINVALGTMALSAAVECTTLWIAYKSVAKAAKKMNMSVSEYVKHGPDQTAVSVMAQDIVSVSALLWATVALSASSATGNAAFDALGSIGVGLGLGWLAYYLGFRNIALLNGHSIPAHQISALKKMLNGDAVVDKAYNLKADYLGPGNVAVSADIDFEGRAITRRFIERERSLECLAKWKPGMLLAEVCVLHSIRHLRKGCVQLACDIGFSSRMSQRSSAFGVDSEPFLCASAHGLVSTNREYGRLRA